MFRELFEKQKSIKELKKLLKRDGYIAIIMGETDTWGSIGEIDGDIGYGIDQYDDDFEINLKTGDYTLDSTQVSEAKGKLELGDIVKYKETGKLYFLYGSHYNLWLILS